MASPLPYLEDAQAALVRHFALTDFRPGQAEVVSTVLSGRNVVVVMPTGAGKSLCYQLPAMLLPGITVVVSPLIALMKDQVEQLQARGIAATFINSTLSDFERADRIRKIRGGAFKLVYVAPERFRSSSFVEAIMEVGIDLFAIDEAHCISQWGHDFRPDYAQLGQIRKRLRPPRTVALTATATPEVRDDIVRTLLMKDPEVFVAGFDRQNLFLEVVPVSGEDEKRERALDLTSEAPAILYCSTRKTAESMHQALRARKRHSVLYHAGMDDESRKRAQDEFMSSSDGVAVATNAFGMGIDKGDIRSVIHINIPRAVEAYYQEIGRAGRNGGEATAVLLFNHSDVYTQERLIQGNHPSESVFGDIWNALLEAEAFDKGLAALAAQVGASEFEVSAALRILEREGKVRRGDRGEGAYGLELLPDAKEKTPQATDAKALLDALLTAYPIGKRVSTELPALGRRAQLDATGVRHALGLLEKARAVRVRRPFAGRTISPVERIPFRELGLNLESVREQERRNLLLLKRMTDYAYAKRCRRAFILRYFGEELPSVSDCGHCDVCAGARAGARAVKSSKAPRGTSAAAMGDAPEELPVSELAMGELRRWRRNLSKELDIPPFIIFNDKTLRSLAAALPVDKDAFLDLKGTGETQWERFGAKVVEISTLARAAGHQPQALPSSLRKV